MSRFAGRRAEAIIRRDETLLTVYLLRVASRKDWTGFTEESAARFLLWFSLYGRHEHHEVHVGPEYLAFLADPTPPFKTRLMAYVYVRDTEARARFRHNHAEFSDWYYREGVDQHGLGPLVSAVERLANAGQGTSPWSMIMPVDATGPPLCVNVIGFANGVLGLGEDVRMMSTALLRAGVHVAVVDVPLKGRRVTSTPQGWDTLVVERPIFDVSIFCLPPFEMMRLKVERGIEMFRARRNIGCWPWELTTLPPDWHMAFDAVDEVWAISPFLQDVYRALTSKRVRLALPHVGLGEVAAVPRRELSLTPEDFVVLAMLDLNSFVARKNPQGAIMAFRAAFPDQHNHERLLIKTLNGHANPVALSELQGLAAGDSRVRIIDEAYPRPHTLGLIAMADVLLSLHRAEGFGRVLVEAMLLSTPVIGTDWSGSQTYLDTTTGWPVACSPRPVRTGEYIYAEGSHWAEPDTDSAVAALRSVRAHPCEARRRAQAGEARVRAQHGVDSTALRLRDLLSK